MPKTSAEKQREYRLRVARRLGARRAEDERRITALEAGLSAVTAERDSLRDGLASALEECERLRASASACRHPAEMVDGGVCRRCGADVW